VTGEQGSSGFQEATPTGPVVQEIPETTTAQKTGTGSSGDLLAGVLQGERPEGPGASFVKFPDARLQEWNTFAASSPR
jgi:hypothetical protein